MEIVAVPGALAVGIGVRLLQVLEGCDGHWVHLSLSRGAKGSWGKISTSDGAQHESTQVPGMG